VGLLGGVSAQADPFELGRRIRPPARQLSRQVLPGPRRGDAHALHVLEGELVEEGVELGPAGVLLADQLPPAISHRPQDRTRRRGRRSRPRRRASPPPPGGPVPRPPWPGASGAWPRTEGPRSRRRPPTPPRRP